MHQHGGAPADLAPARSRLLAPDDAAWEELLATVRHDVFHLPAWAVLEAREEPSTRACALLVETEAGAAFVPLLLRSVDGAMPASTGVLDAVSPRGYPTPLLRTAPGVDPAAAEPALAAALVAGLRGHGIVAAFVRLHPRLGPPPAALALHGEVVDAGMAVGLDLARGRDALWAGFRSNHRRDIRAAERAGYRVRFDDGWTHLDGFVAAYGLAMERLGAAAHWRKERASFAALREALGDQVRLCVVERDGELACGVVVTEVDGVVEYLYSATAPEHVAASPSKLAIAHLVDWGIARGDRLLELGGTPASGDSLARFKLGFSTAADRVASWRVVADPEAYARLVGDRGAGAQATGWFPAYRAPVD